jgi:GntR family transcriptional repressor for pyruvate dehydrogenase complex
MIKSGKEGNMIQATKKKKLSEVIIEEIKQMIIEGRLKEGDKLPNQDEFASTLGVSRNSLREAINTLANDGILEQRPRIGTVVKSTIISPDIQDSKKFPVLDDMKMTIDLLNARECIETYTAGEAAINATEEQINQMGKLLDEMTSCLQEGKITEYIQKNVVFHYSISQASQNQIIQSFYKSIRNLMDEFIYEAIVTLSQIQEEEIRSHEYHIKIYQAIKNRNEKEAITQMKNHLDDNRIQLMNYYSRLGKASQYYKKLRFRNFKKTNDNLP